MDISISKKEGLGFHIQITGTGPYIYQFYVDGVQMPENMDLNRLLIDINNASTTGALIHTVYHEEKRAYSSFVARRKHLYETSITLTARVKHQNPI